MNAAINPLIKVENPDVVLNRKYSMPTLRFCHKEAKKEDRRITDISE